MRYLSGLLGKQGGQNFAVVPCQGIINGAFVVFQKLRHQWILGLFADLSHFSCLLHDFFLFWLGNFLCCLLLFFCCFFIAHALHFLLWCSLHSLIFWSHFRLWFFIFYLLCFSLFLVIIIIIDFELDFFSWIVLDFDLDFVIGQKVFDSCGIFNRKDFCSDHGESEWLKNVLVTFLFIIGGAFDSNILEEVFVLVVLHALIGKMSTTKEFCYCQICTNLEKTQYREVGPAKYQAYR